MAGKKKNDDLINRVAAELRAAAAAVESRLHGSGPKRKTTAKKAEATRRAAGRKAAATRKANAAKRSTTAKKGTAKRRAKR